MLTYQTGIPMGHLSLMSLSDIFENNFTCSESPKCYHGGVTFRLVNSEEKPTYK